MGDIYDNIRDFYVCEENGEVVGCGALHVVWEDLAEVKSLAVRLDHQRRGIATEIVKRCLEEMDSLGLRRVFVLTYRPGFFKRFGFHPIGKEKLPHKVWAECIRCPQFPDCKEEALIYEK